MAQSLYVKCERDPIDPALIPKQPDVVMKQLIVLQGTGVDTGQYLHSIIRAIVPTTDPSLRRLFYYYLETLGDSRLLLLCISMISKDMLSPNEYVRGAAMRFVARLDNYEHASLLVGGIRENLKNKLSYARLNAAAALISVATKFDIDIEEELRGLLRRETNPEILRLVFNAMDRLGMEIEEYAGRDEYPPEVQEIFVWQSADRGYLAGMLRSGTPRVAYKAAIRLLMLEDDSGAQCSAAILAYLKQRPEAKEDFARYVRFLSHGLLDFLALADPYAPKFSRGVIRRAFETAETHQFVRIAEMLFEKYAATQATSEKKKDFRVLLVGSMAEFQRTHCAHRPHAPASGSSSARARNSNKQP